MFGAAAARQLESWGLSQEDAVNAGIFEVADARVLYAGYPAEPALALAYHQPNGEWLRLPNGEPFARIRRLGPAAPQAGFTKHKHAKYLQPPKTGIHAYLPKAGGVDWQEVMADPSYGLIITEGEAKGLVATLAGFPTLALGGVWSFSTAGGALLDELKAFNWNGRDVFITFDSDAADNPQVVAAEARLVYELQAQAGARCSVVRLPAQDDGSKMGLDDFLRLNGPDAFERLIRVTKALSALDAKVVSFNRALSWIEAEGMVWDSEAQQFINKDNLVKGSRWGSQQHVTVGSGPNAKPKTISVAATWLTHPWAQRYGECLFRPSEGTICKADSGQPALNLWRATDPQPGNVQPFLDLTAYIFQNLRPEDRELPLKLMAYKAQNPHEKIPLALVLIGTQGSGKTMWGEIVRDAFAPYGADVTPSQLAGEFQDWLERSLVALINEAKGDDMTKASETLKALISDLKRPMNVKYRPARQVNTYTSYIITSNRRAVGAFAADDRRMIVVDCPPKREDAFYNDYLKPWKMSGGPQHVMHYLLNLDLQGWRPPATAPMSPEKYLAYTESLTQVQRLAEDMRTANENTILLWLDQAMTWAQVNELSNHPPTVQQARAVMANIAQTHIRPWYMPEELALLFPAIVQESLGGKFNPGTPSGRISRELREAGIPYLVCEDDPRGFMWQGRIRQFLVIAEFDEWRKPISQSEFERYMRSWQQYGQVRKVRRQAA